VLVLVLLLVIDLSVFGKMLDHEHELATGRVRPSADTITIVMTLQKQLRRA